MGGVDPFNAPVVLSLSVRVVVDSVFDQFMPKATHLWLLKIVSGLAQMPRWAILALGCLTS